MRQAEKYNQQTWQQEQPAQQLILPLEPSHDDEDQITFDPFMIPPESEPKHSNGKQPSSGARGRGRDRGRGRARGPSREPKKFFCHFHGSDSDHRTNQCPEKKKTLDRMESEKKAKLVGHTTWPQTPQAPQQIQYTQPSFVPPPTFTQAYRPPMFNYNYNHNW